MQQEVKFLMIAKIKLRMQTKHLPSKGKRMLSVSSLSLSVDPSVSCSGRNRQNIMTGTKLHILRESRIRNQTFR